MAITLTTNYKEVLPAKVVEVIDNLVEDGEELDDVLSTLDYFGEEYYDDLEKIIECLNDTDGERSELYDFVDEFGVDNLEYYEKYQELRDDYDHAAVDAFISMYDVRDLENFEDSYEGYYSDVRDLVEEIMDSMGTEIPSWLCIDYESTWNCSLRFDYNEENGYYFRNV